MKPFQVVLDFEAALSEYTGAPYAVTTTSCTAALTLAVAYGVKQRNGALHPAATHIEIPRRTYVGVPYAIREAGGWPTFRDEDWRGAYQLKPLPVWDSARWFTQGLFHKLKGCASPTGACDQTTCVMSDCAWMRNKFACVSFHWSKTLGIQQGGAILHDDPEADAWLRRARFDGRAEGVPPAEDTFPLARAWHCYMSPEVAAEGLVRLSHLPKHNAPLPNDDYQDLSQLKVFQ